MDGKGCRDEQKSAVGPAAYETVRIEKTRKVCPMREDYAHTQASKPVVVMCWKERLCAVR